MYLLRLGPMFPNDVEILKSKVGLGPDQIEIDLRKVFLKKYNFFHEPNKSIFRKLRPRNPRACVHIHAYAHTCSKAATHVSCVHTHARVPKTMKGKFFCIKAEVWNDSHIYWEPL